MLVLELLDSFQEIGYDACVDEDGMVCLRYNKEGDPPSPANPIIGNLMDELYLKQREMTSMFVKGLYP